MSKNYRKSNFRIEQIHGKPPSKTSHEARIRNYIFGSRILLIKHSRTHETRIRVIGYEVPIYARGKKRDECIDLLGYDADFQPWIIELKIGKSAEQLNDVVSQVNRYSTAFAEGIKKSVEIEIQSRLLWRSFKFSGAVNKMILADRSFFKNYKDKPENADDIAFCSFSCYTNEKTLLDTPRSEIRLKVEKRLTKIWS